MDLKTATGFVLRDFFEKIAGGSKYFTHPLHNGKLKSLGDSHEIFFKTILEYVAQKNVRKWIVGKRLKIQKFLSDT